MLYYFNSLSKFTRSIIVMALIFLVYGYLCRAFGIYFFWESKAIGWAFTFIAIINCLVERIKSKKQQGRKTLSEKIFIGLIVFTLIIESALLFIMPRSDAYAAAKQFVSTNGYIRSQVGEVNGFFLIPMGSLSISSSAEGESGVADLTIVVKGNKKYKDVHLLVTKTINTNWTAEIVE